MNKNYMTTEELAEATRIAPNVLLTMMDMGLMAGAVRLVRGRPMFDPSAVGRVHQAVRVADQAAADELSAEDAWLRLLRGTMLK